MVTSKPTSTGATGPERFPSVNMKSCPELRCGGTMVLVVCWLLEEIGGTLAE